MAKFELVFKESVSKDLKEVPKQDVQGILERIHLLRNDPYPSGSVKLSGKNYYRIRQGNYRILYEVRDRQLVVVAVKLGHRREVYR